MIKRFEEFLAEVDPKIIQRRERKKKLNKIKELYGEGNRTEISSGSSEIRLEQIN